MRLTMNSKNLVISSLILGVALSVGCSRVPAGTVGVKVYLLGTNKGVDREVLGVGRYWIGMNEELYIYPTYQVNYTFTKDEAEGSPANEEFTFQTNEGLSCSMDLGVSLHFDKSEISNMFQKYRKGPDEIRGVVVRNTIRDALNKVASGMQVEAVYGSKKAELIDLVQKSVTEQLTPSGIIIDKISIIGSIRLPKEIKSALDSKVAATQKAQQSENELRRAEADARKVVAMARGEAESNAIRSASLNDKIILMAKIENERQAIQKWNGVLPSVSSGAIPFLNINKQ